MHEDQTGRTRTTSARERRITARCLSHEDFRRAARRTLPRMAFDFIDGGAGEERGLGRNVEGFAKLCLVPRAFRNVSIRDQSTELFGKTWASPFAIAPMGLVNILHPKGDLILARCARDAGIPYCLSTAASTTIEDIARAVDGAELWFQLYVLEETSANWLMQRAENAGVSTLVLTIDVVVNGERRRDERNHFSLPLRITPRMAFDVVTHPRWSLKQAFYGPPRVAHYDNRSLSMEAQLRLMRREMEAGFDWDALRRLRNRWKGSLMVKGLLREEDVRRCFEAGVDAVILSNHGARQLDEAPAPIDQLRRFGPTPGGPLLLDSGVREGGDVLKALALGARGVLIGRPLLYALAAAGEAGVRAMLELLRSQLDRSLALTGCSTIGEAGLDLVQ